MVNTNGQQNNLLLKIRQSMLLTNKVMENLKERFYTVNYDDAVADVDYVVDLAKKEKPDLPLFILGHSAGGVLACLYTLEHQEKLNGLICETFASKSPAPDFALAVLKGVGHIVPHLQTIKLKNEDFSRDPEGVAFMNNDPLIADE